MIMAWDSQVFELRDRSGGFAGATMTVAYGLGCCKSQSNFDDDIMIPLTLNSVSFMR